MTAVAVAPSGRLGWAQARRRARRVSPGPPAAEAAERFEAPAGYGWRRGASGQWEPDGWDYDAELAADAFAGVSSVPLRVARAALSGDNPGAPEQVVAWTKWVAAPGSPMPRLPHPGELEALIRAKPELLRRSVSSGACPPTLLTAALVTGDQSLVSAALRHRNLSYEDRRAHLDQDGEAGSLFLLGAREVPLEDLRAFAGAHDPYNPPRVRAAAVSHRSYPRAEAVEVVLNVFGPAEWEHISSEVAEAALVEARNPRAARGILAKLHSSHDLGDPAALALLRLHDWGVDATLAERTDVPALAGAEVVRRAVRLLAEGGGGSPWSQKWRFVVAAATNRSLPRSAAADLVERALGLSPPHRPAEDYSCLACVILDSWRPPALPSRLAAMAVRHLLDVGSRTRFESDILRDSYGPVEPLVALAHDVPAYVEAVVQREPDHLRAALALGHRHPAKMEAIASGVAPHLRPVVRAAFGLPAEPAGPVSEQPNLVDGRFRYDIERPGWVETKTGRPARPAVVRTFLEAGGLRRLTTTHDGVRLAARRLGLVSDPEFENRLMEDCDALEDALRAFLVDYGIGYQSMSEAVAGFHRTIFELRRWRVAARELAAQRPVPWRRGSPDRPLVRAEHQRLVDLVGPTATSQAMAENVPADSRAISSGP